MITNTTKSITTWLGASMLWVLCCGAVNAQSSSAAATADVRALLVPRVESVLSSEIKARIASLPVRNGDRFKKGDVLVKFDCGIFAAERRRALAEHSAARKVLESNKRLSKLKAVGNLEAELSKIKVEETAAEYQLANVRASKCTLKAPYRGRVVKRLANPHETVTQGQPLLEVLDDSQLEVLLNVPSGWLAWLKVGHQFTVRMDETGKQYSAKVIQLGARIDAVSQTLEVTAQLDGQFNELLAGMSGLARFSQR